MKIPKLSNKTFKNSQLSYWEALQWFDIRLLFNVRSLIADALLLIKRKNIHHAIVHRITTTFWLLAENKPKKKWSSYKYQPKAGNTISKTHWAKSRNTQGNAALNIPSF